MQGSSCSHLGATLFRSSLDHDSLASIGSKTLSEESGSFPPRVILNGGPSVNIACEALGGCCGLADPVFGNVGFLVGEGVELAATRSDLPSWQNARWRSARHRRECYPG